MVRVSARMRQPPRTSWVTFIAATLALAWVAWLRHPDFPLDDAYIVQHSVDGLLHGGETRFIGSTPLQGTTSPASLLLISALAIVLPTGWAQVVVTSIAAVLYLVGVFRLATDAGAEPTWAGLLAALALLVGNSLLQLLNGLETGLAMAAISWTLVWFRGPEPECPRLYALLGVLPFIRPELAALGAALLARAAWSMHRRGAPRRTIAGAVGWVVLGALPVMVFLLANGAALLPNTVAAKAYFFAEGCLPMRRKLAWVKAAGGTFLQAIGLAFLGFVALPLSRARWAGAAFIPLLLLAYALRLPGALFHNFQRYLYVLLPFAMTGWAALLGWRDLDARRMGRALLLLAVALSAVGTPAAWRLYAGAVGFSRTELAGMTDWLAAHVSEDDVVLVHDAGYVSLRGRQPLVDLVGLKSPSSVAAHRRWTWTACRRDPRAIDEIARESGARYLVVLDDWDRLFRLSEGLRSMGWHVTRADVERGATRYAVYHVAPPADPT